MMVVKEQQNKLESIRQSIKIHNDWINSTNFTYEETWAKVEVFKQLDKLLKLEKELTNGQN